MADSVQAIKIITKEAAREIPVKSKSWPEANPASLNRPSFAADRVRGTNDSELARVCDLSRTTVYKYIEIIRK